MQYQFAKHDTCIPDAILNFHCTCIQEKARGRERGCIHLLHLFCFREKILVLILNLFCSLWGHINCSQQIHVGMEVNTSECIGRGSGQDTIGEHRGPCEPYLFQQFFEKPNNTNSLKQKDESKKHFLQEEKQS